MDESTNQDCSDPQDSVASGVEFNGQLLEQVLEQLTELRAQISTDQPVPEPAGGENEAVVTELKDQVSEYERQIDSLQEQAQAYQQQVDELRQQNEDLASKVASTSVRQTVACAASDSSDALSWEARKQLILEQMENDSFDAESFHSSLGGEADQDGESIDPIEYLQQLNDDLASVREQVERKDDEISELRCLLDQQSGTQEGGVAIGAAAIAEMVDSDELVQQERERLQKLKAEWEEKFRQGEIEASLERAKLSRERQELARKNVELEEQLEHIQREARHAEESGPSSRRWLAKLGLADSGT